MRASVAVKENSVRQIFPEQGEQLGPVDPLPQPGDPAAAKLIDELARIYAYPEGRCVRANMIASVDGAISVQGRSGGLSGLADRLLFGVLRSLADVILVGAGTARAEKYGLVKPGSIWPQLRQGRPATPPIAVVSRSLRLDLDSQLIHGEHGQLPPTIVFTTKQAPADQVAIAARTADVIVTDEQDVPVRSVIEQLSGLRYRRILVEGGPTLLAQLTAADLLDELCVTTSPLLEGGHSGRMLAAPGETSPSQLKLMALLEDDGFLLGRYGKQAQ
jgi:riboflavin biosynthesis pyrimidine reductase